MERRSFSLSARLGAGLCLLLAAACARGPDTNSSGAYVIPGGGGSSGTQQPSGDGDAAASDGDAASGEQDGATQGPPQGDPGDAGMDTAVTDPAEGGAGVDAEAGEPAPNGEDASGTDVEIDPGEEPGDFPRTDERSPALNGRYTFATYSEGIQDPAYGEAVIYYPTDAARAPYAAVVMCPDTGRLWSEDLTWWAETLASHGIVAMGLTPARPEFDDAAARADDLEAAVRVLWAESVRAGSPLEGNLARLRIAVAGHGTGGLGALLVAERGRLPVRAVLALQPRQPGAQFANIQVPVLITAGQNDAPTENAYAHYQSIPETTEKVYVEYAGADVDFSTGATQSELRYIQAKHALAFLKLFVEDNSNFETYLYGAELERTRSVLSRYETSRE